MSTVRLLEVTKDNFYSVCKLSETLSDYQKRCVAPNAFSIAEAHFHPDVAWYRAICLEDVPIGFVMLQTNVDDIPDDEKPAAFLWRMMIARDFQGRGYGKDVLDLLVEKCRAEGKKYLFTSCVVEQSQPYDFYVHYGFHDTGDHCDDEVILKYKIA